MIGVFIGMLILSTSCKKYLDINENPNTATSATPELILPLALTNTAGAISSYNSYGAQTGLYAANAGGYGGFGESITYNYTTTGTGLWPISYDNLEDYQTILNTTDGVPTYSYFNAVARIMRAYNFQMLVDAFNDIPYTEALQGSNNLTPAYTAATEIYKDLTLQLDTAIATIDAGAGVTAVVPLGSSDVMFGGDVDLWKQFANTLKLRIILRANGKVQFANTTFSTDGFLTADALINPGYARDNGKQNPAWNSWAYSYTGGAVGKSWMPSQFIFGFYDGHSLTDPMRGGIIYYKYPNTGINRLGVESYNLVSSPTGGFWYAGTNRDGKSNGSNAGILKGPDAGMPAMLASESDFLQAEAAVKGIISGDADELFNTGIEDSYNYLYQLPDGTTAPGLSPSDSVARYKATNASSYLVNFPLATTTEQKIEAIITQKFIALNFINSQEAWNEYRRTRYPTITSSGNGYQTFASSVSESTRPDKLPTRILYPTTEGSYNSENVPTGISPFTSFIFWAKQ